MNRRSTVLWPGEAYWKNYELLPCLNIAIFVFSSTSSETGSFLKRSLKPGPTTWPSAWQEGPDGFDKSKKQASGWKNYQSGWRRRIMCLQKMKHHLAEKYLGFTDPLVGVHQVLSVFTSSEFLFFMLRLCRVFFKIQEQTNVKVSWESWGQHQRFRGPKATFGNPGHMKIEVRDVWRVESIFRQRNIDTNICTDLLELMV